MSNSNPIMIVVPIWPTTRRSLATIEPMVKANTSPAMVTTRRAGHGSDHAGFEAGPDFFLESGYQEQVVVGSDGQHDNDGHGQHEPVQWHMQDVLPDEDRQSEG